MLVVLKEKLNCLPSIPYLKVYKDIKEEIKNHIQAQENAHKLKCSFSYL